MLQNIRDKSHGLIAWVILGFISLTFALWGVNNYFGNATQSAVIVKINGTEIRKNQVDQVYERIRRQVLEQMGNTYLANPKVEKQLRQEAMQQLVNTTVLSNAAMQLGLSVSPQQIEATLTTMPAFQEDGKFSQARFLEALRAGAFTQDSLSREIRDVMLINQLRMGLVTSAFALSKEVEQVLQLINQVRDVDYLIISPENFISQQKITDKAIKDYYSQYPEKFKSPEQVSVEYIQLKLASLEKNIQCEESELQKFYNDNIALYTSPERWHVAHLLIRSGTSETKVDKAKKQIADALHSGRAFADVVKQHSDDVISSKQGGDLGWITKESQVGQQFSKALEKLKVGEISNWIVTENGQEKIKILGRVPAKVALFETVKRQVSRAVRQQKAQQLFAEQAELLTTHSYETPDSLQPAADALGVSVESTPLFSREGTKTGITANPAVIHAAFGEVVLSQHYNSDVIELGTDAVVVLRLKKHQAEAIRPLSSVKEVIKKDLIQQGAVKSAEIYGQRLLKNLQTSKKMQSDDLKGLKWHNKIGLRRDEHKIAPEIVEFLFRLPFSKVKKTIYQGETISGVGFVIGTVKKVTPGKLDKINIAQQKALREQYAVSLGMTDYSLIEQFLIKTANIKMDTDYVSH